MVDKIGLIGAGNMGRPIAENLLREISALVVYDKKPKIMKKMEEIGAKVTQSPAEVASQTNVIFVIVPSSTEVDDVLFGQNGVVETATDGTVIVDMTTSEFQFSTRVAERLSKLGLEYLDSPMTGGVLGAKEAQLLLMVGGKHEIFKKYLHFFEIISKRAIYLGKAGSGHLMKLIHNQLSHATFLATCEAVTLGQEYGLSSKTMIEVFNSGNARSYATEVRFPRFILPETYDMGATFETVYKDISIVRKIGEEAGLRLPINDCTYQYWQYGIEKGEKEKDCTVIFQMMKNILSSTSYKQTK